MKKYVNSFFFYNKNGAIRVLWNMIKEGSSLWNSIEGKESSVQHPGKVKHRGRGIEMGRKKIFFFFRNSETNKWTSEVFSKSRIGVSKSMRRNMPEEREGLLKGGLKLFDKRVEEEEVS